MWVREREGGREEEKRVSKWSRSGFRYYFSISNYNCEMASSRISRMVEYLRNPGKEENEGWELRDREKKGEGIESTLVVVEGRREAD